MEITRFCRSHKYALMLAAIMLVVIAMKIDAVRSPIFPSWGHDEMAHTDLHLQATQQLKQGASWSELRGAASLRKPPLPYLVSALARQVLPGGLRVALAVNILFGLGLLLLIYYLGARLFAPPAGLFAVCAVVAMPLSPTLMDHLGNDTQVSFFTAAILAVAVRPRRLRAVRWWAVIGVLAGLGMLSKPTLPLYVAGPLVIGWALAAKGAWRSRSVVLWTRTAAGPVLAVLAALGLWWSLEPYLWDKSWDLVRVIAGGPNQDFAYFHTINGQTFWGDMNRFYGVFASFTVLAGTVAALFFVKDQRRAMLAAAYLPAFALLVVVTEAFSRLLYPVAYVPLIFAGGALCSLRRETLRTASLALLAVFFLALGVRLHLDQRVSSDIRFAAGNPVDAGRPVVGHLAEHPQASPRDVLYLNNCTYPDMAFHFYVLSALVEAPQVGRVRAFDATGQYATAWLNTGLAAGWRDVDTVLLCDEQSEDAEAADKVASARAMDGSPFSMVDKPLKMEGDENPAFRRPTADQARDGFVSNLDAPRLQALLTEAMAAPPAREADVDAAAAPEMVSRFSPVTRFALKFGTHRQYAVTLWQRERSAALPVKEGGASVDKPPPIH